jgi:hypothetical protein
MNQWEVVVGICDNGTVVGDIEFLISGARHFVTRVLEVK